MTLWSQLLFIGECSNPHLMPQLHSNDVCFPAVLPLSSGSPHSSSFHVFNDRVRKHSQATHLFKTSVVTEMILRYAAGIIFSRIEHLRRSPRPVPRLATTRAKQGARMDLDERIEEFRNSPEKKGSLIVATRMVAKRSGRSGGHQKWPKHLERCRRHEALGQASVLPCALLPSRQFFWMSWMSILL